MKPSRYVRVKIDALVRLNEPRLGTGVCEGAGDTLSDCVASFAASAIKDAEYIMPGIKLTVSMAQEPKWVNSTGFKEAVASDLAAIDSNRENER